MHACMHCTTGIIDECAWQVLGGADLFLQGLIVPPGGLGDFSAGDVRAVAIPQNPFPFAVRGLESGSLNQSCMLSHQAACTGGGSCAR